MSNTLPLVKMSQSHYRSEYGYFFLESSGWSFVPFEKNLKEKDLIIILETLKWIEEGLFDEQKS